MTLPSISTATKRPLPLLTTEFHEFEVGVERDVHVIPSGDVMAALVPEPSAPVATYKLFP